MLDKLYPYQLSNAQELTRLGFGCDLSEVGTGKTLTALGVVALLQDSPVLIIAPKSVAHQWQLKFEEFYPDMKVFRPQDSSKQARYEAYNRFGESNSTPKALIVTYEQARLDVATLYNTEWGVIYADEVHRFGNPLTKLYKAIKVLRSNHRFGATATPLRSSPLQAYGIFNWLRPGSMGKNYWHFKAQYVVENEKGWGLGYKNLDHLAVRIRPYYVKTTMEEAGVFMPPLVEEDLTFELGAKTKKLYDNVRKEMLLEVDQMLINKIENPTNLYLSIVKLGKLSEITDHLELVGEGDESAKLDTLKDSLVDVLASGSKAVIFSRFSRMCRILERELVEYNPAIIIGDIKDRQAEINKFDNDDTCKVIIISSAGSEGINLQKHGSILYFYDVPMGSYGMLQQVEGRINRIGQIKPMVVYYLIGTINSKKTVDGKLRDLLLTKKSMSEKIFPNLSSIKDILK